MRTALKKKDQEVSQISEYQATEAQKLKDSLTNLQQMKEQVFDLNNRCQYLELTTALEQKQKDRFQEIEKMFVQVDYALEDIKSSMATTDTFIDHYMPHKINKMTIKMLRQLYQPGGLDKQEDELRDITLRKIEEQQQKELYMRMLTTTDKK